MRQASTTSPMTEITPEILNKESGKLYGFALQRVGDRHYAEDLVRDCLSVAWRKRDSFCGRSALTTWLFGIMKFKVLDHFRAAKRTPPDHVASSSRNDSGEATDPLDQLFTPGGTWKVDPNYGLSALGDSPDDSAQRADVRKCLRRCVANLPKRQRLLFILREVDELSVPEAAVAADVTAGGAAVLLTRARHKLRARLQLNKNAPRICGLLLCALSRSGGRAPAAQSSSALPSYENERP
jgi:RNA polymerase sigma-70 factor (ECF subfamily)